MGRDTVRSYRIVFKCRGGRANACSGAPSRGATDSRLSACTLTMGRDPGGAEAGHTIWLGRRRRSRL